MDSKVEKKFISIVTDITFLASSTDWNLEVASLFTQLLSACIRKNVNWEKVLDLHKQIQSLNPKMEFVSLTEQLVRFVYSGELNREWTVVLSLITQIIFLASSMDLDSESELISLINQIVTLFNSKQDSESELVSLLTQMTHLRFISLESDSETTQESELLSLISQLVSLKPETELTSLIRHIISRFKSMNWEPLHFISVCPQTGVKLEKGKFCVITKDFQPRDWKKRECHFTSITFLRSTTTNHFHCGDCNGKNHEEYDKLPVEVKHPLHPKHPLRSCQLNWINDTWPRECYCCDEDIRRLFYYCSACDFALNIVCVNKPPPVLSIDLPKWHEHPLALFPSQAPLTCNLCAITHSSCPFYICPPCDFVAHQKCLSLPRVIRISRHPHHRISFTPSFYQGDWVCGICRTKIDNDYGGYSCIKEGCSYAAHSRCATQTNVWDGQELEGVPEEVEEEILEPFVRICDGVIQHFSHQKHHLRLDENACRDYDEKKICQACITPIYFGNFYFCMECKFIIHETCANLPRKIFYSLHPHRLTLVGRYEDVVNVEDCVCSTCHQICTSGFFYECGKEECFGFKLHVHCATTSEPFVHVSHMHPLFLTSKPKEKRKCLVCECYKETFNCIEGECEFSLCFDCAIIPQKVRYKHDKHMLTLFYGEETSTMTYWCEVCEAKVNPREGFYKCDEYCCVTLHIECLRGKSLYMKPGSSLLTEYGKVGVQPNNQHMSRPFCSYCKKRCPDKIVFEYAELIYCSGECIQPK